MTREAAFSALFAAVSSAYSWGAGVAADEALERSSSGLAPGALPARKRAGNLSVGLACDAEANL